VARRKAVRLPSPSLLERPGPGKRLVSCLKHDALFAQGDPAGAVFYILEGSVKLTVAAPAGKGGRGGHPGPRRLRGGGVPRWTTRMDGRGDCDDLGYLHAHREEVHGRAATPAGRIFREIHRRNIRIEEGLIDHLFNTNENPLARALLLLA
jgi:CRP/FNR family cyclic AMP-dependent transcriptional regulator